MISGYGYATYRLTVLLNARDKSLALKVLDMSTAFTLFVNGEIWVEGEGGGKGATFHFFIPG